MTPTEPGREQREEEWCHAGPAMCRMDHPAIVYDHGDWPEDERCPFCRARDHIEALKRQLEARS